MEKKNKIHLTGHFDLNFGDDMMMLLVVRSLQEVTFVVEDTVSSPILEESNVIVQSAQDCALLPKLIVIGCGFMIDSKEALITEMIAFLKGRHPGDFCLGCNIEPLNGPVKRFLISRKMNKIKLITCRDKVSHHWLRKYTSRPKIHCLPDILFSIQDECLPERKEQNKLGISLMHRAGDREDCAYYCTMAEIADEWIRSTGKDVLLMAFDTGRENDLFACESVKSLMEYPEHVQIVAHHDCTEIPEAFSCCEKIIATRFHAMVLSLRMGIPFYPLIFREKARNLLKDIRYPFASCDIDDIDTKSLRKFILETQRPYLLGKDMYEQAREHTRLLWKHITAL